LAGFGGAKEGGEKMKRILLSIMTIALVSGGAYGATQAFFTDTEKSQGNMFTAGTIDISVAGQNPWNKTYPMLLDKPSQTNYINFTIENVGNNEANVWKRLNNVTTGGGASTFCSVASSEPEYVEGGGQLHYDNGNLVCDGTYTERDDLDSYMVYDLYVCPGQVGIAPCEVEGTVEERASGKPIMGDGHGWVAIIPESNQVRVDNVNGIWIKLNEALIPSEKLAVSQSYHLTAWDDAQEPTVNNWAQGDVMNFDIELEARQLTAPAPGSTELASTELKEKDPITWDVVPGGASGTLSYNTSGDKFNYSFTASGLNLSTNYSLIYYADPYPGDHPGALIGSGTSNDSGVLSLSGSPDLGMDLPTSPDANYPAGAKIQLVLSSDYNGTNALTAWHPSEYLFELNLINYDDTGTP